MNIFSQAAQRIMLASGIATAALVLSALPAQAATFVSAGIGVSFGGGYVAAPGYAPRYHWYRWRDGYGWHRRWVPIGWAGPVAYGPAAYYPAPYAPAYAGYGGYWRHDRDWHDGYRDWHRDDHRDWQHH